VSQDAPLCFVVCFHPIGEISRSMHIAFLLNNKIIVN